MDAFLIGSQSNYVRSYILLIPVPSSNLGYMGSETRSLGQIMEKPCLLSSGCILYWSQTNLVRRYIPVLIISWTSSNLGSETRSLHLVKSCKNLVCSLVAAFLIGFQTNLVRSYILIIFRPSWNFSHLGSETRSLSQIMEKPCPLSVVCIFDWICYQLLLSSLNVGDMYNDVFLNYFAQQITASR